MLNSIAHMLLDIPRYLGDPCAIFNDYIECDLDHVLAQLYLDAGMHIFVAQQLRHSLAQIARSHAYHTVTLGYSAGCDRRDRPWRYLDLAIGQAPRIRHCSGTLTHCCLRV